MTSFLRLLDDKDKSLQLSVICTSLRAGEFDSRVFQVDPNSFRSLPKSPFAYWVSDRLRAIFKELPAFASDTRAACVGIQTNDDFRFIRTFWEVIGSRHIPLVKGGSYATFYSDVPMMLRWGETGRELKASVELLYGTASKHVQNQPYYFRPGITWSQRSQIGLSVRALSGGAIFGVKGPSAFFENSEDVLPFLSLFNSSAFKTLVSMQMAFGAFDAGVISRTPVPMLSHSNLERLKNAAVSMWSLKRSLDTIEETSHAFVLPSALRARLGHYDPSAVEAELARIQSEIDNMAFELYGFDEADRAAAVRANQHAANVSNGTSEENAEDDGEYEDRAALIDKTAGLLSWSIGVAFGRFDWRLATGERAVPSEPGPFDPLPAKSPGMLPDGADPFHVYAGILVDDPGHHHDVARVTEEVLARVDVPVPEDVRRWLQRDFFSFHLQRYSKSRRKAPIYWPLSTASNSYTLWVYYPSLTSQTLYTAINDFVEPKLKQVGAEVAALRNKGSARTRNDEKQFEVLQALELELIELRDTLLKLAPAYKPNHDDGVQITAAPLWPLFRHKPWQKVLKDTWAKLEQGDYDWASLAVNNWPERVSKKCKTDKSLAIVHGLEHLYVESEVQPKKTRGRRKAGGAI